MIRKSLSSTWSSRGGELAAACRRVALATVVLLLAGARLRAADLPEWLEAARHVELGEFGKGAAEIGRAHV